MVSPDTRFEFAVVGGGMFGAAAARHLALAGHRVVLIAPMEPLVPETHDGVFGSHYDEARITRVLDSDPLWAQMAHASIDRYGEIEASTGIRFHHAAGFLALREAGSGLLSATTRVGQAEGVAFEALDALQLADRMPFLSVGSSQGALLEAAPAGYVNPRALVRAQIEGARAAGALVVAQTVLQITETPDGVDLLANTGSRYLADRALLAAGAYTNELLVRPLDLEVQGRMVLLAALSEELRDELSTMPSIIHEPTDAATTYLLPPVTYPDGVTYVKIGIDEWDRELRTPTEANSWFRSGEDETEAAEAREALVRLIPSVAGQPMHTKTCVYTITASGYPYIGMVNDRIGVVVGGNGRGAKSSDEIGRLGAAALLGESIDERLAPRLAS
jgi:glycine/D-amino acid oxidase-like deaminating enzyme